MHNQARSITTNQTGIHQNLHKVVTRHLNTKSQKPLSAHTQHAFQQAMDWLNDWQGELILDSCCGVGESTVAIAQSHAHAKIIGVDKSALRTNKHQAYSAAIENYLIVRADLHDFIRLLVLNNKKLTKHYLLYPNPYPKTAHLQRRWHAMSTFAEMLKLGGTLEVRSNWQLYIDEFSVALSVANIDNQTCEYKSNKAITPFERKYWQSGQNSWQLTADLNKFANKNV